MIPDGNGYYYDACHNNCEYCRYVKQRPIYTPKERIKTLDKKRKFNEFFRKNGIPF